MSDDNGSKDSVSMILFSGDLDKAMAAFTIANGAAGSGMPVTIFFTFWGLSLLRKEKGEGDSFLENLFKKMMPAGAETVGLSRFNFGGMGAKMLRKMLHQKEAFTPESLMKMAMERHVNFVVCEASMKILGITQDELIDYDHLSISGVESFLQLAKGSKIQLFI
ncbi:MAG TPA: DsrE/DsrF/DrsH-like family protein [Bacillota bacterium]|jgi:peroxiredoxin family protein|nr:DsrE/DsrF/DrsH-like family protein [Bacillota bacterium]